MPAVAAKLQEIVVDCSQPAELARFWSAVLGWPATENPNGFVWLSSTATFLAPEPLLVFVPVPEPKTVKNRLHLDLCPSGVDQAEELDRLLALGATRVDVGQGDAPWIVLADPEGNEFCLLARRVD